MFEIVFFSLYLLDMIKETIHVLKNRKVECNG